MTTAGEETTGAKDEGIAKESSIAISLRTARKLIFISLGKIYLPSDHTTIVRRRRRMM
jgi:hypothetical protein